MTNRICLPSGLHPGNVETRVELQRRLDERGVELVLLSVSDLENELLEEGNAVYHDLTEYAPDTDSLTTERMVEDIKQDFGIRNLRPVLFPAKQLTGKPDDELIREAYELFYGADRVFEEVSPDIVIQAIGAGLQALARFYAAEKRGVVHRYTFPIRFPGRLSLMKHNHGGWHLCEVDEVTEDSVEKVKEWIDEVKEEQIRFGIHKSASILEKDKLDRFVKLVKKRRRDPESVGPISRHVASKVRRRVQSVRAKTLYSSPDFDEDYIFFPLHLPPDSQLTVRGQPYHSQEFLVELLDRNIPFEKKLYVKEHPNHRGAYGTGLLKEIKALDNTKLIPPTTNSHRIIRNSDGVAVINSTVGMEALLYQKPILTFGESIYRGHDLTIDVRDPFDVPEAFGRMPEVEPDMESVIEFFARIYQASFREGIFETGSWADRSFDEDALETTVEVIEDWANNGVGE